MCFQKGRLAAAWLRAALNYPQGYPQGGGLEGWQSSPQLYRLPVSIAKTHDNRSTRRTLMFGKCYEVGVSIGLLALHSLICDLCSEPFCGFRFGSLIGCLEPNDTGLAACWQYAH